MTPEEFKARYLKGMLEGFKDAPEDARTRLEQRFSEFIQFPPEMLAGFPLPPQAKEFLSRVGLPKAAAPALNFRNMYELEPKFESHPFFRDFFLLGSGGHNRLLAIDTESEEVVCINPPSEETEIDFVNASLATFAECLCLFQEYRDRNELDACFEAMCRVDPKLEEYGGFWDEETQDFFDNVLDRLNEAARKASR